MDAEWGNQEFVIQAIYVCCHITGEVTSDCKVGDTALLLVKVEAIYRFNVGLCSNLNIPHILLQTPYPVLKF